LIFDCLINNRQEQGEVIPYLDESERFELRCEPDANSLSSGEHFPAYKICPNLLKLAKAPASEYARRACRGCEHKYGRYALLDSELKSSFEINRVYRIAIGSGFTPKWQNPIQAPRDAVEATREIEINGTKVKFTNSDVKWPAGIVSYSHRVSTSSGIGIIRL
jgi:hypothetical protein